MHIWAFAGGYTLEKTYLGSENDLPIVISMKDKKLHIFEFFWAFAGGYARHKTYLGNENFIALVLSMNYK